MLSLGHLTPLIRIHHAGHPPCHGGPRGRFNYSHLFSGCATPSCDFVSDWRGPRQPVCRARPAIEIDTPAAPAYIRRDRRMEEKMTAGTFGDHLKREREMRGVSLDEISAATRIATRFLRAIEKEQWDQLPGGVFNRGFVRAVARYLGLDEEDIVAEYAAAAGDRPTVPVWTGSPPTVTPDHPWLAWVLGAMVTLLIATGG